ncbi:DUF1343 domain-containing protein [Gammaproteobacteria bacterium]|nr:DUF1343 domain-containing protein [Gammaproteobacteria bacterium]
MSFGFGIDRLLRDTNLQRILGGSRVALLGHPASVTRHLRHSVDALMETSMRITALFGPQHGIRGDKQDNMVETGNDTDPVYHIPVFSLYGKVRRPTVQMLDQFDVLLVDLQDVGCRIYTFLATLFYLLEDCTDAGKSIWVLDRPNPAGRPVDGLALLPGNESFVGAAPMPMRHGLTLGEAAKWYCRYKNINADLNIVLMDNYHPDGPPGYGWPGSLPWVNPSPNLATLNSARVYSGTVVLEGTTLSEGRGTTRPLECMGAPGLPVNEIVELMRELAPAWLRGCFLRPCYFEPTFHKHVGQRCTAIHIHADHETYDHDQFKPFRLVILFLKALRLMQPEYDLWRDFYYEYETGRLAIDVINGGPALREWVDDPAAAVSDMEALLATDEREWLQQSTDLRLY